MDLLGLSKRNMTLEHSGRYRIDKTELRLDWSSEDMDSVSSDCAVRPEPSSRLDFPQHEGPSVAERRKRYESAPSSMYMDRVMMARSAFETSAELSTPGTLNYPLRDRLRQLSRTQRKELLMRAGAPIRISPIDEDIPEIDKEEMKKELLSVSQRSILDDVPAEVVDEEHQDTSVQRKQNHVQLHIYDLISQDTLMQLPWGCVCEIGKCFNEVNSALHQLGTGAYHVGVEVNGVEYAFGATTLPGRSGVFSCVPRLSPGYQYRTSINFGSRDVVRKKWVLHFEDDGSSTFQHNTEYVDGKDIIREMASEYMGIDYDILRKNCCTFARDACLRLGVSDEEIPSWFRNLAESGALTQDLALATVAPLTKVLSCNEESAEVNQNKEEDGFEVVSRPHKSGNQDLLVIMSATSIPTESDIAHITVRRAATSAY